MDEQINLFGQTARFAPIHKTCGSPGVRVPIPGVFFEIVRRCCDRQTSLAAAAILQQILFLAGQSRGVDFARKAFESDGRNELEFVRIPARFIASGLHLGESTVADLLSKLVEGGLIDRVKSTHSHRAHRYRPNLDKVFSELRELGFEPTWKSVIGSGLEELRHRDGKTSAKRISFSPELWRSLAEQVGSRRAWVPALLLQQILLRSPLETDQVSSRWLVCSHTMFADELWLSRTTIARGVDELRELGLVEVESGSPTKASRYRVVAERIVELLALAGFEGTLGQIFGGVDAATVESRANARRPTTQAEGPKVFRVPEIECSESREPGVPGAGDQLFRVPGTKEQEQEQSLRTFGKRSAPSPPPTSSKIPDSQTAQEAPSGEVVELSALKGLQQTFAKLLEAYGFECHSSRILGELALAYFRRGARADNLARGLAPKLYRFEAQGYRSGSVVRWLAQDVDEWCLPPGGETFCGPDPHVQPQDAPEGEAPCPANAPERNDGPHEDAGARKVWDRALEELEDMVSAHLREQWFAPLVPVDVSENELTLAASDAFCAHWIRREHLSLLREVCGRDVVVCDGTAMGDEVITLDVDVRDAAHASRCR